jgi:arsenate reductase
LARTASGGPLRPSRPDPARVTDALSNQYLAFADTMRMLDQRIGIFVNLPIDKLSKLSLQHQLEEIGHIGRATEPA